MHKRWIEIHILSSNYKYKWNVYKKWSVEAVGAGKGCKKKGFPSQWNQNPLPASPYVTWFPAFSRLLFCLSCPHSLASFLEYAGILGPFCLHVFLSGMLFPKIFWWFLFLVRSDLWANVLFSSLLWLPTLSASYPSSLFVSTNAGLLSALFIIVSSTPRTMPGK